MDYLKRILQEILSSGTGSVSSIDCINFTSSVPKLTKTDGQKSLERFISSQWLKLVQFNS